MLLPTSDELVARVIVVAFLLLIGFPFHEYAHAQVAYWFGDATAKMFGRLTLDPRAHFDRQGGMLLIFSGLVLGFPIGYAQTPINPANLRNRRNAEVYVALAGPAANLLLAVIGAVVFRLLLGPFSVHNLMLLTIAYTFVLWNVVLAIINFIPIPGLDGSAIVFRFLSPRTVWQIRPVLAQYGFFILLAIVLVFGPALSTVFHGVTDALVGI